MSTPENINAGISVLVDTDMSLEHLDGILTTLAKHGLHPKYYEPEQDAPKADAALVYMPETTTVDQDGRLVPNAATFEAIKAMRGSKDGGVVRLPKTVTVDVPEVTTMSEHLSYDKDKDLTTITETRVYEGDITTSPLYKGKTN